MKKNKIFKRMMSLFCCLTMMLSLAACGGNNKSSSAANEPQNGNDAKEENYHWILATAVGEDTVNGIIAKRFKDLIEETSGGRITVDLYQAGSMGNDKEIHNGLVSGSVDYVISTTSNLLLVCPEAALFDAPYMFDDIESAREILAEFLDTFNPYAEACGVHILGFSDLGFRIMTSNKPVNSLDDFRGMTIRTMENKYQMKFFELVGATATPTDFSEVYTALQQGVVDGQSNAAELTVSSKFYEPQKYLLMTNHEMHIVNFLMNNDLYNKMPDDVREMVDSCAAEAIAYGNEQSSLRYAEKIGVLADNLEVIDWDSATRASVKEAVQPEWDLIRNDVGDELVDSLLAAIEAAK